MEEENDREEEKDREEKNDQDKEEERRRRRIGEGGVWGDGVEGGGGL